MGTLQDRKAAYNTLVSNAKKENHSCENRQSKKSNQSEIRTFIQKIKQNQFCFMDGESYLTLKIKINGKPNLYSCERSKTTAKLKFNPKQKFQEKLFCFYFDFRKRKNFTLFPQQIFINKSRGIFKPILKQNLIPYTLDYHLNFSLKLLKISDAQCYFDTLKNSLTENKVIRKVDVHQF
ncbi:hypothetical protein ABPG74_013578 [Tetrahymena malaccensis]